MGIFKINNPKYQPEQIKEVIMLDQAAEGLSEELDLRHINEPHFSQPRLPQGCWLGRGNWTGPPTALGMNPLLWVRGTQEASLP